MLTVSPSAVIETSSRKIRATTASPELRPIRITGRTPNFRSSIGAAAVIRS